MAGMVVSRKDVLKHGDISAIARATGLSVQHVSECVKGNRTPSRKLARAIDRMVARRTPVTEASAA